MSASTFPEPSAESMQPNRLRVPKLSFTTMVCPAGVVMWSGGCALVVRMTVFEAFNFKPVLSSVVIKASSNDAAPSAASLKTKMSSANRRSSSCGYPSWKSIPSRLPLGTRVVLLAGCCPNNVQCIPKSCMQTFYTTPVHSQLVENLIPIWP